MKQFADLFLNLDRTNKTNEKVALLRDFFSTAPEEDRMWALALFTGRRPSFKINTTQMQQWALETAGIPSWLFRESYNNVGDLGETISLILPVNNNIETDESLAEWFAYLVQLPKMDEASKREHIINAWTRLSQHEIFVFNKLLMGSFRIGVSQTLLVRAVAEATGMEASVVAHRMMGEWTPFSTSWHQ